MDNTNLETLAIENTLLYPTFDTNITQYNAEVSNEVVNLNLLAIPEDEKAEVTILGTNDLHIGENAINIIVTASDKITKKEYTITVIRRSTAEEQKYKNEQKENQEKLEEIYNTLDIKVPLMESSELKEQSYEATRTNLTTKQKNSNNWYIVLLISFVIVVISVLIIKVIFKNSNKHS